MKFCYLLSLASQAKFTSTVVVPKFLYHSVGNWRSRLSLQNRVYPDFCELQEPQRLLLFSALHIRMSLHNSKLWLLGHSWETVCTRQRGHHMKLLGVSSAKHQSGLDLALCISPAEEKCIFARFGLWSWPTSTSSVARQDVVGWFGQPDLLGFRNQKPR